jgi:hypothetical protein
MRYTGEMQNAADSLGSYFSEHGWQLTSMKLDSGALLIKVTRNNGRDSGEITIDPYPGDEGRVRITAIVFI